LSEGVQETADAVFAEQFFSIGEVNLMWRELT
jgi:hypothetical protein